MMIFLYTKYKDRINDVMSAKMPKQCNWSTKLLVNFEITWEQKNDLRAREGERESRNLGC